MTCKSCQYLFMILRHGNSELAACKGACLAQSREFFTGFREKVFARAGRTELCSMKRIFFL